MKSISVLLVAMIIAVCGAFPVQAADESAGLKIAVVDVIALQTDSKAGKSIKTQVDKIKESYKKEFEAKEKELQGSQEALIKEQEKMPKDEFVKKAQEFQQKIVTANQALQEKQRSADKAVGEALEKLRNEIIKVVGKVSSENNYSLVLPRQSVFYFDKSMNITDEILKQLDKNVKDIKVDVK